MDNYLSMGKYNFCFFHTPDPQYTYTHVCGRTLIFICTHRLGHYLGVNILNVTILGCVNFGVDNVGYP